MAVRVALASTDGVLIDAHFNRADRFYVYDLTQDEYRFVGQRELEKLYTHAESEFDKVLRLLSDCDALFVSRLGPGAARYLLRSGLRVFEAPYAARDVLDKLVREKILEQPGRKQKNTET